MSKLKTFVVAQKRKFMFAAVPVATAMMAVVPAFAVDAIGPDGAIDPTLTT